MNTSSFPTRRSRQGEGCGRNPCWDYVSSIWRPWARQICIGAEPRPHRPHRQEVTISGECSHGYTWLHRTARRYAQFLHCSSSRSPRLNLKRCQLTGLPPWHWVRRTAPHTTHCIARGALSELQHTRKRLALRELKARVQQCSSVAWPI